MDKEYIRSILPIDPPEGLIEWALKKHRSELGPEYIIYHCERVPVYPDICEIMEYQTTNPRRTVWAAICDCTACQGRFVTTKVSGEKEISMVEGEDGTPYELDPGGLVADWGDGAWQQIIQEGDIMNCPNCLAEAQLIHGRKLTGGRTKQFLVTAIQNVEQYTAVIYWLIYRHIDEFGLAEIGAKPTDAYVLDEEGKLNHFTCMKRRSGVYPEQKLPDWKQTSICDDAIDQIYHDWRSINNRKQGTDMWTKVPDLTGCTGEKTGLAEYIGAGGWIPVKYLKMWRKYRSIENLSKTNCAGLVADIIKEAYRYSYDTEAEARKYIDLSQRKPHRMLGIPKEDFRELRSQKISIDLTDMQLWEQYRNAGGKMPFIKLKLASMEFKKSGTLAMVQLMKMYHDADIDKLRRYMEKQKMRPSELGILLDTRRMAKQLAGNRELTPEEMWPRNLAGTHERLSRLQTRRLNERNAVQQQKIDAAFQKVRERFAALLWNDGELCVILPGCEADLIREGNVLRHCVGSYANEHIAGTDTIFFIRHYRRPERPYYTLDIDMTGRPMERQLHGYGNERHGVNKEYEHKIPKKVREFCDRWQREILRPWYAAQQKLKEVKSA